MSQRGRIRSRSRGVPQHGRGRSRSRSRSGRAQQAKQERVASSEAEYERDKGKGKDKGSKSQASSHQASRHSRSGEVEPDADHDHRSWGAWRDDAEMAGPVEPLPDSEIPDSDDDAVNVRSRAPAREDRRASAPPKTPPPAVPDMRPPVSMPPPPSLPQEGGSFVSPQWHDWGSTDTSAPGPDVSLGHHQDARNFTPELQQVHAAAAPESNNHGAAPDMPPPPPEEEGSPVTPPGELHEAEIHEASEAQSWDAWQDPGEVPAQDSWETASEDPYPPLLDGQVTGKPPSRAIAVKSSTKSGAHPPVTPKSAAENADAERQRLTGFTKSKPAGPPASAILGPPSAVPPKAWPGSYGDLRPPPPQWQAR